MTQMPLDLNLQGPTQIWVPTRAAALEQLETFLPNTSTSYARQRNFDFGPGKHSKVSQLSPWIRHRLLLEEDVLSAVLSQHSLSAAEKFIQEVFWRGYFKGWLEHRPEVWRHYKQDLMALFQQLETDRSLRRRYEEAISGQTGLACFDAWAEELTETGYLHNHARMWFASLWIYTLKLPWQLGADFFYRHLIDGDPASNTCSWRWVCGLHTLGKTYLARANNIAKYTAGRFDPAGELASSARPLEDRRPITITAPDMSLPDVSGQRLGLILTEEDNCPEQLDLPDIKAILALSGPTERSLHPLGKAAKAFAPSAMKDTKERAEAAFERPVTDYNPSDWSKALQDWTRQHELDACLTARLPIGPVRTRLSRACREAGIELFELTRPYDAAVWPYTKKGFFALKKKIPSILQDLRIG